MKDLKTFLFFKTSHKYTVIAENRMRMVNHVPGQLTGVGVLSLQIPPLLSRQALPPLPVPLLLLSMGRMSTSNVSCHRNGYRQLPYVTWTKTFPWEGGIVSRQKSSYWTYLLVLWHDETVPYLFTWMIILWATIFLDVSPGDELTCIVLM